MSKVLFSIEQWELIRRLRNSGINKEQICQAFDDLERVDRDLGNFCQTSSSTTVTATAASLSNQTTITVAPSQPPTSTSKQLPIQQTQQCLNDTNPQNNPLYGVDPNLIMKNLQLLFSKNLAAAATAAASASSASNASSPANGELILDKQSNSSNQNGTTPIRSQQVNGHRSSNDINIDKQLIQSSSTTNTISTNTTSTSTQLTDAELEAKSLDDYKARGDYMNHIEISQFVHKFDLKQSQIAKMSGVNQSTISKFLRGDTSGISENARTLIYKWYLKFTKNPFVFGKIFSNNEVNDLKVECSTMNGDSSSTNGTSNTTITNSVAANTNGRRTRFSFKPEHLVILENYFVDNQYPDSTKREELARLCNQARGGDVSEKERVTEQMVMNWFQNKRNLRRTVSMYDEAQIEQMTSAMEHSQHADSLEYEENSRNSPQVSETSEYD